MLLLSWSRSAYLLCVVVLALLCQQGMGRKELSGGVGLEMDEGLVEEKRQKFAGWGFHSAEGKTESRRSASDARAVVSPSPQPPRRAKPWEHLLAGTAGGMCGVLMSHPLDTLRVRLQTSVKGVTPFQMAADILNDTGVRGFYRGVISPVAGAGMIKASVFGGYGVFKDLVWRFAEKRGQPLTLWHVGVAAMGAGFVASFVVTPIDRIKVVMQAMSSANGPAGAGVGMKSALGRGLGSAGGGTGLTPAYSNSWACATGLVAEHGLWQGLFTGLGATLVREIPGYATYFVTYEVAKRLLTGKKLGDGEGASSEGGEEASSKGSDMFNTAIAGGLAGICAWLPIYPVDVIKSRVQSAPGGGPGMLQTATIMWQAEGISSFFKGLAATLARGAVNHSATFVVYEAVVELMMGRRCPAGDEGSCKKIKEEQEQ